ncbi:oligosaccharide flippase family protein [Bradyrhizobium sp. AZCC 1693]|uniref:oligosaccharide flippase family protein n=1 Tax=Bradyrhizobium sp. AZCC 1693 TaxID=3117029 RepID=UPI002FF1E794
MTLRQRALRAGAWTVASYGVELSTRLLTNLIMTRLLFPDAFGVVAAATALIVGLLLLSDFGVKAAIIQNPHGEDREFLCSAWVFQLFRGASLWLIIAIVCLALSFPLVQSALPSESVFASDSFPPVACILGLNLVLSGCESTAISLNVRQLNFRPIVILDLTSRIIPVPIMIVWAYFSPTVWAIVGGSVAGSILRAALSHAIIPGPRMAFAWRQEHFKEIVAFGKWINLSSWATFVSSQSDVLFLGLLVPGPMLGIYYVAKTLSDALENVLERLNATMTLPVLGEVIRRNPDHLQDRYYRFRLPIEIAAAGSAGFIFSSGNAIVHFLYDQRYAEAGVILQILSFGLLLYPFQLIRSAFTAIARPSVVAWVSVLQATCLLALLSLGYYFHGPLGAVAGVAGARLFPSIAIIALAYRQGWISLWKELRWIPAYAFGFFVGIAATYLVGSYTILDIRHFFG